VSVASLADWRAFKRWPSWQFEWSLSRDIRRSQHQNISPSTGCCTRVEIHGSTSNRRVVAPSGYSIVALVEDDDRRIVIEVDGPSHFIHRKLTATTMLKRRQITAIDKITLVSVLYWKWGKHGKDSTKKQQYLRSLIGIW
jgi:hypothetical protein